MQKQKSKKKLILEKYPDIKVVYRQIHFDDVTAEVQAAIAAGLIPIACVGETEAQRLAARRALDDRRAA